MIQGDRQKACSINPDTRRKTKTDFYWGSQYSISTCICSFMPALGLAEADVLAIPLILASFPVPPVMGPTVVAVKLVASGPCTETREPRVKNLSPFSSTYIL